MPKRLYYEPTMEDAHAVATLMAARLPRSAIMLRTGLTKTALLKVMSREDWAALLLAKQDAVAVLMKGAQ